MHRFVEVVATKARLTALLAVAVVVGAAGGMYAVATAGSPGVTVTTMADQTGTAPPSAKAESEKAKPASSAAQGAHGACVSAVARNKAAVGGPNDNHGGAVSQAAKDCPRGSSANAGATGQGKPGGAGKSSGQGKQNHAGKPSSQGKPNHTGKPDDAGTKQETGPPSDAGRSSEPPADTPESTPPTTAQSTEPAEPSAPTATPEESPATAEESSPSTG